MGWLSNTLGPGIDLVLDIYKAHDTEAVEGAMTRLQISPHYIVIGMTDNFHPLDLGLLAS